MQSEQISQLSFANSTVQAVDLWAANLPLVNTDATAEQLLIACDELARLEVDALQRFELLDTIRPLVHYICSRLHRAASTNGINGISANVLAAALSGGYHAAFNYCKEQDLDDKECRWILARAGHRFLAELGREALYCAQHYLDLRTDFWRDMHAAYGFLVKTELAQATLKDSEESGGVTSNTHMYLRNLLFATCKPNQLSPQQLQIIFITLEQWVAHTDLEAPTHDDQLLVNLAGNKGPGFQSASIPEGDWHAINVEILCYEAEAFINEVSTILVVPEAMSPKLIAHLIQAWSAVQPRNFRRSKSQGPVRLCIGLRAVHYFLSGGMDFNEQISNAEAALRREVNPFLDVDYEPVSNSVEDDPWSQAHDLKTRIPVNPNVEQPDAILWQQKRNAQAQPRKFDHFDLVSLDTSPGGYRLQWQEPIPRGIQVGDLVGLREESDNRWCVAVLRWISRQGDFGQIGLQLLAPRAIPVAIRPIRKKGGAEGFSRGILLPALEAIGQPATIVTPRLPFKSQQKVTIHRQGLQSTGLLQETLLNTESFNQFSFRMLDGYLEKPIQNRTIDPLSAMTREDSTRGP